MRIAILLYGYFFVDGSVSLWRALHSKTQLNSYYFIEDSFKHFMSHIYTPLKNKYQNIDVYMITHQFEHPKFQELKKELLKICNFFNIYFTNKIESPRLPYTYFNLLRYVINKKIKYDRYLITRGDLFYKKTILNWIPNFPEKDYCWCLFKDHKETWEKENTISDIIFLIDNKNNGINTFMNSVRDYVKKFPERNELHGIYSFIKSSFKNDIDFITDGHYDSNTAKNIKESCNPIYIMINRKYYFDDNDKLDKNNSFTFSLKNPSEICKKIIGKSYSTK